MMKLILITLLFTGAVSAAQPHQYSNGASQRQAEEEEKNDFSLQDQQERMEERRGWKGSSIEPPGSKIIENDDQYPREEDRKDQ